jgi:hypothetical protein
LLRNESPTANSKRQMQNIERSNVDTNIATISKCNSSPITRIHKSCVKPGLLQTKLRAVISEVKDPTIMGAYVLPNQI